MIARAQTEMCTVQYFVGTHVIYQPNMDTPSLNLSEMQRPFTYKVQLQTELI